MSDCYISATGLPWRLTRKRFLRLAGAAALSGPAAAALLERARRPGQAAGSSYGGLSYTKNPISLLGQAGSGEERVLVDGAKIFSRRTGVDVKINPQPWTTLMEKIQADHRSGSPTYDIFWSDLEFAYTLWPYLIPLNDFIDESKYPMDGFFPTVKSYGEGIGGQKGVRFGLPIMTDTQLCWYRSDKIKTFPTTWQGFEQMLKEFTGGGRYALGNAGVVEQGIGRFLSRYWSIPGTTLFDAGWNPRINGEQGVHALEMYRRQATNYSPPGFQAWEYSDAVNAFLNGDVVVHEGWPEVVLPWLNDPSKNKAVGNHWGAAPYPERGAAQLVQHNLILFKTSKNPKAAFDFMAYSTNKERARAIITQYRVDSPRKDVWQEILPSDPVARKLFPGWSQAMSAARPFARPLPQWLELYIPLGEAVTTTVAGKKTPKDALDECAKRWRDSINKAKPNFPYREFPGA
jgi:multiple sugar transport system substrate-binding protein